MKAYQWLTLSAAIAITVLEGMVFTSASSVVSPLAQAEILTPDARAATPLAHVPAGSQGLPSIGEGP